MATPLKCGSCGRLAAATFTQCPFCGQSLAGAAQASAPTSNKPRPRQCPPCGRLYNPALAKCPFCGATAPAQAPSAAAQTCGEAHEFTRLALEVPARQKPFLTLDFSEASIHAVDLFIDTMWGTEGDAPGDAPYTPSKGKQVFVLELGCYFGEVLRRLWGGRWQRDAREPSNALMACVVLTGEVHVFAHAKVFKRFKNGGEDALGALVFALRAKLGPPNDPGCGQGFLDQAGHFERVSRSDLSAQLLRLGLSACAAEQKPRLEEAWRRAQEQTAALSARPASPGASPGASAMSARQAEGAPLEQGADVDGWARRAEQLLQRQVGMRTERPLASLAVADLWLAERWAQVKGGPEAAASDEVRLWGSYLGKLLVRRLDGAWDWNPAQPETSTVAASGGLRVCPFEAARRTPQGPALLSHYRRWVEEGAQRRGHLHAWKENELDELLQQAEALRPSRPVWAAALARIAVELGAGHALVLARAAEWLAQQGASTGEEALAMVERAMALEAKSLAVLLALARLSFRCGQRQRAEQAATRALELRSWEAACLLGEWARDDGRYDAALGFYERGVQLCRRAAPPHLGKGRVLGQLGRYDEACAALTRATALDEKSAEAWYYRGFAEELKGDLADAHDSFSRYLERRPPEGPFRVHARARVDALREDPRRLVGAAAKVAQRGSTEEAVAAYAKVVENDPSCAEAWRERGVGLSLLDRMDEARSCLQRALELAPHEAKSWDHLAVLAGRRRQLDEGLRLTDEGLRRHPSYAPLWIRRGYFLFNLGRTEECLEAFDKAQRLDRKSVRALVMRSEAEMKLGRKEQARRSLEGAAALADPSEVGLSTTARRILWELETGKKVAPSVAQQWQERAFERMSAPAEALTCLDEAVAADPFQAEIWFNRGSALRGLARFDEALASYQRALDLSPGLSIFLKAKGEMLRALKRYDEALEPLTQAYERSSPPEADTLVQVAQCLCELSRFDEALSAYDEAIGLRPDDRKLWLQKSVCLSSMGLSDEASELQVRAFEDKAFADQYHQEGLALANALLSGR